MRRALAVEQGFVPMPSGWLKMHSFLMRRCDGDFSAEPPSIDLLDFMVALRMEARSSFTELHLARFLSDGRKAVRLYGITKRAALAVHGELAHIDSHRAFLGLFQQRIPKAVAEMPIHRNIMIWLLLRKTVNVLRQMTFETSGYESPMDMGHAYAFFRAAETIAVRMPSGRHLVMTEVEARECLEHGDVTGDVATVLEARLTESGKQRDSYHEHPRHPLTVQARDGGRSIRENGQASA